MAFSPFNEFTDFSATVVFEALYEELCGEKRDRLRRAVKEENGEKELLSLSDSEFDAALHLTEIRGGIPVPTVTGILLEGKDEAVERFLPSSGIHVRVLSDFKTELGSIILQALTKTFNKLSGKYSIKEVSSCADVIRNAIMTDDDHVYYWNENYGFSLTNLVIESIDYSEETKRIIKASNKQSYENKLKMKRDQANINLRQREAMTFDDQYEAVLKLTKLKDMGVLTESEFEKKKKEIMGL